MTNDHVMLDLETMSTEHDAAVVSIGAVLFSPWGEDTEETIRTNNARTFYTVISLESNQQAGRHISASTVIWWMRQSKEAQEALLRDHQNNLKNGIYGFRRFIDLADPMPKIIWAKSPDFDCTILQSAHKAVGEPWLFQFWNSRCVRTVVDLAYPEGNPPSIGVGVTHNALDDAIRQALMVQACYRTLHGATG